MRFQELRDDNGTLLQSYVETLKDKAREHGFTTTVIFANRDNGQLHVESSIAAPIPLVLRRLADAMSQEPTEVNTLEVVTPPTTVH